MEYECIPAKCTDCGGIGHTMEECRKKRFEVAKRKIQMKMQWVQKTAPSRQMVNMVVHRNKLATISQHPQEEEQLEDNVVTKDPGGVMQQGNTRPTHTHRIYHTMNDKEPKSELCRTDKVQNDKKGDDKEEGRRRPN